MTEPRPENATAQDVRAAASVILRHLRTAQANAQSALANVGDDRARDAIAAQLTRLAGAESIAGAAQDSPLIYSMVELNIASMAAAEASAAIYTAETAGKASDAQRSQELAATFTAINRETASFARDLFGRRPFDPYLQFDSDEERQEYERRRKQREEEVNQHLAAGTPEGNLHALTTSAGQMLDDAQHGAANSPEFEGKWNELQDKIRRQKEAMKAAGIMERDITAIINGDLRKELHRMGRPAEEIDRIMSSPDPMNAAKEQITHSPDAMRRLGQNLNAHQSAEAVPQNIERKSEADMSPLPPRNISAENAAGSQATSIPTAQAEALNFGALLNAAGITTDTTPSSSTGHGLNVAQTPAPNRGQGNSPV